MEDMSIKHADQIINIIVQTNKTMVFDITQLPSLPYDQDVDIFLRI